MTTDWQSILKTLYVSEMIRVREIHDHVRRVASGLDCTIIVSTRVKLDGVSYALSEIDDFAEFESQHINDAFRGSVLSAEIEVDGNTLYLYRDGAAIILHGREIAFDSYVPAGVAIAGFLERAAPGRTVATDGAFRRILHSDGIYWRDRLDADLAMRADNDACLRDFIEQMAPGAAFTVRTDTYVTTDDDGTPRIERVLRRQDALRLAGREWKSSRIATEIALSEHAAILVDFIRTDDRDEIRLNFSGGRVTVRSHTVRSIETLAALIQAALPLMIEAPVRAGRHRPWSLPTLADIRSLWRTRAG